MAIETAEVLISLICFVVVLAFMQVTILWLKLNRL